MLRVIAGKHRGRKLEQPPLSITRPTMDRVKEAIFNVIQFRVEGSIVLDLFAGSGSLSIEAVSRGAIKSIAVDKSPSAIQVMQRNLTRLKIDNVSLMQGDVINFIKHAKGTKFDIIFMDPPFAEFALYEKVLQALLESELLKEEGLVILETKNPRQITIPEGYVVRRQKKYGISTLIMLANNI